MTEPAAVGAFRFGAVTFGDVYWACRIDRETAACSNALDCATRIGLAIGWWWATWATCPAAFTRPGAVAWAGATLPTGATWTLAATG